MAYRSRVVDRSLSDSLRSSGGVLLEGARATGKTRTGLEHASSSVRLDRSPALVELALTSPAQIIEGAIPRLVDEWQLAPPLWNVIRHEIDDRQVPGQFILSGSAAPADDVTRHTGIGRISRLRMRPMALQESGHSSGQVSLAQLAAGRSSVRAHSEMSYAGMAELAIRGGWPAIVDYPLRDAARYCADYLSELVRVEIGEAVGVRHAPGRMQRLIQALSRNIATEATLTRLAADVGGDGAPIDAKTVRAYLDALERVFAIDFLPPWSVSLRSRSRLRTAPKVHLADPSLACAALRVDAVRLARDIEYFGLVFESMVIRDLRVYSAVDRGEVHHYRDNTGLEVDAVIEYPGGVWGAVEVKLGEHRIGEAEANLLKLARERVDTGRIGEPAFLMVVTAGEYGRTLPSGVHVVPLATLAS